MPRKTKEIEEMKAPEMEEKAPTILVPEKKEKKKRTINPETMTYLKAFSIYKKETGHKGISPKKGSKEYEAIIKIMKDGKK
jgi:hypothetical protein